MWTGPVFFRLTICHHSEKKVGLAQKTRTHLLERREKPLSLFGIALSFFIFPFSEKE